MAEGVIRKLWLLLLGLLVVSGIVTILAFNLTQNSEQPPVTSEVRVGYLPIYVDLPLFVAKEKGFFANRGIDVSLHRSESSPDMGASIITGRIDAGASIATSSALAIESRDPGKFNIFLVDAETPTDYLSSLVVRGDDTIKDVIDLKGKKVASFPGPTAQLFGPLALEKLGLERSQYEIIELPIGSHISALQSEAVDALITYEPVATQAVLKRNAVKLVPGLIETNVINPWQAGIWILSKDFTDDNPELAKRFVLAIYDAVDFIRRNPAQAKEALKNYTSIDPEIAQQTPNIPFTKTHEVDKATLQRHVDLLVQHGTLSRPINIEPLIMDINVNE